MVRSGVKSCQQHFHLLSLLQCDAEYFHLYTLMNSTVFSHGAVAMKSVYKEEVLCREIQKEKLLFGPDTSAEQTGQSFECL